jgi:hypothetical protein
MGPVLIDPAEDWIPCRVVWERDRPLVDWCYLGGAGFTEPFFQDTITRALRRPFSAAFLRRTPNEALEAAPNGQAGEEAAPRRDPAGLIFHMSRCGSTLISQMLKAISGVTVFSEAPPVDTITRAPDLGIDVTENRHADWLRSMVRALGRAGTDGRRAYLLKLDCWHVVDLPLFRRAFPSVPWIFLYRDPTEVLASHGSQPAEWTLPGYLKAERFGFDATAIAPGALMEYRMRLVAGMLRSVLEFGAELEGHLVNYSQLPDWGWTTLPKVFGLDPNSEDIAGMQQVAMQDSKRSTIAFAPDTEQKRASATAEIQALSDTYLYPLYEKLEQMRITERRE